MRLPKAYRWLEKEESPRHLLKAIELFGTTEKVGHGDNPVIMGWAKETLLTDYGADSIPWCGLFMAVIMKRANRPMVVNPLWALNWKQFGMDVPVPMLGDVLVFIRSGGGHVGLYVGEDKTTYHVLGGNQGDKVSIVRIMKNRLVGTRRPRYQNQPTNVRVIELNSTGGVISSNEA